TRSEIQLNPKIAPDAFEVPKDLSAPYDPGLSAWGETEGQYLHSWREIGLAHHYLPQVKVMLNEVAPGVVWLTGGSHHSLAIEMADHLIVVEAPLYEERSQAVISALEARFPGKPIRSLVSTHFHYDHLGGVRAYAAKGASIVASTLSQDFIQKVLDA